MEIRPYPEEQRCQNCSYARVIEGKPSNISCRYAAPNIKYPYWPEVDSTAWCAKWEFNLKIKPETKEIIYNALTHPTNRVGHIETFTNDEKIVRKRIKEKYPEAVFKDEQNSYAIDLSNPHDPWGWAR
jgi:hypothetical protein